MLFQKLLGTNSPKVPVNINFIQSRTSATSLSSYTFSSVSIGTASLERVVVIGVTGFAESNQTVDSVTVNGSSATKLANSLGNNNYPTSMYASIWVLPVGTGSTASIEVNFSNTFLCCSIHVFTFEGTNYQYESLAPTYFDGSTNNNVISFANAQKGDAVVLVARIRSAQAGTWSISPLTENFDLSVRSGVSGAVGGHANLSSDAAPYNVTLNVSPSGTANSISPAMVRFYR